MTTFEIVGFGWVCCWLFYIHRVFQMIAWERENQNEVEGQTLDEINAEAKEYFGASATYWMCAITLGVASFVIAPVCVAVRISRYIARLFCGDDE